VVLDLGGLGMDTLQQSLNQVLEGVPAILLQKLIDKKLQKQGIPPSKDLSKKLTEQKLCLST
jgi:hypothetical protein